MTNPSKILRLKSVQTLTGLSRSAIYAKAKTGEFPKSIALGIRTVGWLEADVVSWIDQRVAASKSVA